jgi:hypothetical protein
MLIRRCRSMSVTLAAIGFAVERRTDMRRTASRSTAGARRLRIRLQRAPHPAGALRRAREHRVRVTATKPWCASGGGSGPGAVLLHWVKPRRPLLRPRQRPPPSRAVALRSTRGGGGASLSAFYLPPTWLHAAPGRHTSGSMRQQLLRSTLAGQRQHAQASPLGRRARPDRACLRSLLLPLAPLLLAADCCSLPLLPAADC